MYVYINDYIILAFSTTLCSTINEIYPNDVYPYMNKMKNFVIKSTIMIDILTVKYAEINRITIAMTLSNHITL